MNLTKGFFKPISILLFTCLTVVYPYASVGETNLCQALWGSPQNLRIEAARKTLSAHPLLKQYPHLTRKILNALRKLSEEEAIYLMNRNSVLAFLPVVIERSNHATELMDFINPADFKSVLNSDLEKLNEIPHKHRQAFIDIHNRLSDQVEFAIYIANLMVEVAEYMIGKGRVDWVENGFFDYNSVRDVLIRRFEARGQKVQILDTFIEDRRLFQVVTGPFVDHYFLREDRFGHGTLSHLLQLDYADPILDRHYPNRENFFEYLRTELGTFLWSQTCDIFGRMHSPDNLSVRVNRFLPMFPNGVSPLLDIAR